MLCPNCDSILNIRGCLSCGWQNNDPWPNHRLVSNSVNPLKPGAEYPARPGAPLILKNFGQGVAAPTLVVPEAPEQPQQPQGGKKGKWWRKHQHQQGYVVGDLKDEGGNVTDHVLVGPIPISDVQAEGGGPSSTEQQATLETAPGGLVEAPAKEIPDPASKTIQ